MPRPKHRHKAGGKSVKGSGQNMRVSSPTLTASDRAWVLFNVAYKKTFFQEWPTHETAAFLLDIVSDQIFDPDTLAYITARKDKVFSAFVEPFEDEDGNLLTQSTEDAEAALDFLVEQNMVVVDGDTISLHPRFADVLTGPPASGDVNEERRSPAWSA
jgi:hypothetical protein